MPRCFFSRLLIEEKAVCTTPSVVVLMDSQVTKVIIRRVRQVCLGYIALYPGV